MTYIIIAVINLVVGNTHTLPAGKYELQNSLTHAVHMYTVTPSITAVAPGTDTLIYNDSIKVPINVN